MRERVNQILIGNYERWVVFVPVAIGLAVVFFLYTSQYNQNIVHLIPDDVFEFVVVCVSMVMGAMIGYKRGGFLLPLVTVATIWFGSVLYWSFQSAPDTQPAGAGFAFLVGFTAAVAYGIPSYVSGRVLRSAIGLFRKGGSTGVPTNNEDCKSRCAGRCCRSFRAG